MSATRSATPCKPIQQPAPQAWVGHDHNLRREWIAWSLHFQLTGQRIGESFGAAAAMNDQVARVVKGRWRHG